MKIRQILLAFGAVGLCTAVQAGPIIVADQYFGADDHDYGDTIEASGTYHFDISQAVVELSGTSLTVDIYTNYVNHIGEYETEFGDLLLSESWSPHGDAPYTSDNADNGTHWGWGLALGSQNKVTLYDLAANNSDVLLSDHEFTCPRGTGTCIFRNGQAVRVDTDKAKVEEVNGSSVTGTWSVQSDGTDVPSHTDAGDDYLRFKIDLAGTSLLSAIDPDMGGPGTLALHWTMTCANDVIEGSDDLMPPSQVPEPTALSLLGLGLGLMGFRFRGRRHGRV